jgi:hypothetical protein
MERNVAPTKPRPAVPCRVDPSDEVEVVHVLNRTAIRSLRGEKELSMAHT